MKLPVAHASVRISNRSNTQEHDNNQLYLTELSSLQLLIARQTAALALHPLVDKYYTMNKLLDTIDTVKKKNSIWSKMLFAIGTSSKKNKMAIGGILGKPLDVLVQETGVASNASYGSGTVLIPLFMDECISALKRKGFLVLMFDLSIEGIFRKNGNIKRLKECCEHLTTNTTLPFLDDNPIQLSALLKRFFRDLPEPLLTFKLSELFIISQSIFF
jgi:hypothetical protein